MIDKKAAIEAYKIAERNAHDTLGDPAGYLALTGQCPVAMVERQAQRLAELLKQLDEAEAALAAIQAKDQHAAGIEAAAHYLDKKRESFDYDNAYNDPDTGTVEFKNNAAEEYSNTLCELAEEIRADAKNQILAAGFMVKGE